MLYRICSPFGISETFLLLIFKVVDLQYAVFDFFGLHNASHRPSNRHSFKLFSLSLSFHHNWFDQPPRSIPSEKSLNLACLPENVLLQVILLGIIRLNVGILQTEHQ